jgi:hypothetical protein
VPYHETGGSNYNIFAPLLAAIFVVKFELRLCLVKVRESAFSEAKATSNLARTAMAAVWVQAIWTASPAQSRPWAQRPRSSPGQRSLRVPKFRPRVNEMQTEFETAKRSQSRSMLPRALLSLCHHSRRSPSGACTSINWYDRCREGGVEALADHRPSRIGSGTASPTMSAERGTPFARPVSLLPFQAPFRSWDWGQCAFVIGAAIVAVIADTRFSRCSRLNRWTNVLKSNTPAR